MVLSPGTIFLLAVSLKVHFFFIYIYIIYINDLPANCLLNSVPQMYADDTHLTFASNNILNINTVKMKTLRELKNWLLNYQQDYS